MMDDMAADDDDDNDVSLAKIKSQMGFADDEHGTFIGLPNTGQSFRLLLLSNFLNIMKTLIFTAH